MSEGTQRRLAAIVAADVVGYSRLMGADEAGTLAALRNHRAELIDPMIAEHGGRIVKTMGDGLLLEFPSVVDATQCVLEVQQAMAGRNEGIGEDKRIVFRIGVHLGDLVVEGDDIFGDGINIAARLEALCEPGGIAISGTAHDNIAGRIEAGFADAGEQQLKNIARPVRVWQWTPAASPVPATTEALALPDKPSIAVLPFDNMSGDPEQEYFSDGITEDVITALSRFRSFFVIARNSTFTYKGQAVSIREVGRELGVRYVVEGSVRKAGNRVRVTAQLIEAESGNHVWAERYDRDLDDIFALQDEITETIVGAVEREIGNVERVRAAQKHPENLQAWELLQRGMFHVWQMTREGLATGADFLKQSIEMDPNFAEAHANLSLTYLHQVFLGTADDTELALSKVAVHTHEAIRLDDTSSVGHEMLARLLCFEHRYDEAIATAKRAVQFNPNSCSANFSLGAVCFFAGRPEEALDPMDHAIRLSPKDHRRFNHLHGKGAVLCEIGRPEEGIELLREAVSMTHGDYRSDLLLARYASEAGLVDEARQAAARMLKLYPGFTLKNFTTEFGAVFHPDYVRRFLPYIENLGFPEE